MCLVMATNVPPLAVGHPSLTPSALLKGRGAKGLRVWSEVEGDCPKQALPQAFTSMTFDLCPRVDFAAGAGWQEREAGEQKLVLQCHHTH